MDYYNAPATSVLRHLLFRTPQGWTYWFFSAVNVTAGILTLASPTIASWELLRSGSFFLVYPLPLLAGPLISYLDDFEPSWTSAVYTGFVGVMPFLFPYFRDFIA